MKPALMLIEDTRGKELLTMMKNLYKFAEGFEVDDMYSIIEWISALSD